MLPSDQYPQPGVTISWCPTAEIHSPDQMAFKLILSKRCYDDLKQILSFVPGLSPHCYKVESCQISEFLFSGFPVGDGGLLECVKVFRDNLLSYFQGDCWEVAGRRFQGTRIWDTPSLKSIIHTSVSSTYKITTGLRALQKLGNFFFFCHDSSNREVPSF